MENKIQAHTVSPPHTRLPLDTFPLCDGLILRVKKERFYSLYTSLIWGSEWSVVVLGHLL